MRHIAANVLTLLIIALAGIAGLVAWAQNQFERPGPLPEAVAFEVRAGDRMRAVSERLEAEGIVRDARLFRLAARYTGDDARLRFGDYLVPAGASMKEVMALITSGRALALMITIPEGWATWQVIERLNAEELLSGEIGEWPAEGSLAPDTYAFTRGESRESLIRRMQQAQERILAEAWENRADGLPITTAEEALILASIIEKEAGGPGELAKVASVFYNRMARRMRFQMDATIIYGITRGEGPFGREITRSDIDGVTERRRHGGVLFNTYQIDGLPPTPIANPGRAAILAALQPAETPYLYFVADGTGGHAFAMTLEEHNRNVRAWRQIRAEQRRVNAE